MRYTAHSSMRSNTAADSSMRNNTAVKSSMGNNAVMNNIAMNNIAMNNIIVDKGWDSFINNYSVFMLNRNKLNMILTRHYFYSFNLIFDRNINRHRVRFWYYIFEI